MLEAFINSSAKKTVSPSIKARMKKLLALSIICLGSAALAAPVGQSVWLYSDHTASYVTVDTSDGNRIEAKGISSVSPSELFYVENVGGGKVALQASNGNYLQVNTAAVMKLYATTTNSSDPLAQFIWNDLDDGTVRLQNVANGLNVRMFGFQEVLRADTTYTDDATVFSWGAIGGTDPEPIQHLDASDASSITGNPVSEWSDLSGNDNDAVPAIGSVAYPSSSRSGSGLKGVDFGSAANSMELLSATESDAVLDFAGAASGNSGFAVLVAFKIDALGSSWQDILGNSSRINKGLLFRLGADGSIKSWLGTSGTLTASGKVSTGDTVVLAANYDAATGTYEFWNSEDYGSFTTNVAPSDFSQPAALTMGRTTGYVRFLDGMIGEVKVFDQALTAEEFSDETSAMAHKWGTLKLPAEQPNIVFIYVDDWGWNGTPFLEDDGMVNSGMPDLMEMPNLESLVAQGMSFRNAYGSPQCSPARAALLTGQSNPRNGYTVFTSQNGEYDSNINFSQYPVIGNGANELLDPSKETIPEVMRDLGYATALYGKWHNRGNPEDIFGAGNAPTPPPNFEGDTDANRPGNTIEERTLDDIVDPKLMTWITSNGLNFMEEQAAEDKPFFLMLSHYAMHQGQECFPASRARYQHIPEIVDYNKGETDPSEINRRQDPAVWLGMAYELDQKIGEVMDKLVELGIDDNTYVIVTADNGYRQEFFDEVFGLSQPLHGHKWWAWEAGIRVPMIVRGPGIPENTICDANVINYDFLPTFAEWAGGNPAALSDLDGTSLAGLMKDEPVSDEFLNRSLYFHFPHYREAIPHSVIIQGSDKVVYFYETEFTHPSWDPIMYFDLSTDIGEYKNIYSTHKTRGNELYNDLMNYLDTYSPRDLPKENPSYDASVYEANRLEVQEMWGPFIGTRPFESDEW